MKNNTVETMNIEVETLEEKNIIEKALVVLDKYGFRVASKKDLVLVDQIKE